MFSRLAFGCLLPVVSFAALTARADAPRGADPPIVIEDNVVYGEAGGDKLTLHLARPAKSDAPAPGVLLIHRGGWVGGSKDRYKTVIQDFARHGYVAASVGYRFAPKHKFPSQIEDCKCAVRWMRAHAKELNLDANRIGAIGESAGAYLSMMLGTLDPEDGMDGEGGWKDQSSKVQAVVSFYGPTDLRWETITAAAPPGFWEPVARRLLTAYIGGSPEKSSEQLHRASPIKYVDRRDAPTLLVQGTADLLVLPNQAALMSEALTKAGVEGRLEMVFGKGHDWDGDDFFVPLVRARQFLDERLKVADAQAPTAPKPTWNRELAAKYLDDRALAWREFPKAKQADGTRCISCHTSFPYLTARGSLARLMRASAPAEPFKDQLADVATRVDQWKDLTQWYHSSDEKTAQSRGTEAVLNALLLAVRDAESPLGGFSEKTRQALDNMWAEQRTDGDTKGSWAWLDFKLEPWESVAAEYWGAALAALAVGIVPESYAAREDVAPKVALLAEYLRGRLDATNLHNRVWLALAARRLEGLLTPEQQQRIAAEILAAQRPDGGWSSGAMGAWKMPNSESDAYATGVCTYVLLQFHEADIRAKATNGAKWLAAHQDAETGAWPMPSLNVKRDPASFIGQFMQDGATAFAVFALVESE